MNLPQQTIERYNELASSYETRWKAYLEHTHTQFIARIGETENDTILDISGGTGLLAQLLLDRSSHFKHYIINDPSEQMLAIARNRLSDEEMISFSDARTERLAFEASRFDQVFCLNSFHFYANQKNVLDQCHTSLKPGGKLCILDWNRDGFFRIVNQVIKWSTAEYLDTRSLPEIKEMLKSSGFRIQKLGQWRWRYWKFFFVEGQAEN